MHFKLHFQFVQEILATSSPTPSTTYNTDLEVMESTPQNTLDDMQDESVQPKSVSIGIQAKPSLRNVHAQVTPTNNFIGKFHVKCCMKFLETALPHFIGVQVDIKPLFVDASVQCDLLPSVPQSDASVHCEFTPQPRERVTLYTLNLRSLNSMKTKPLIYLQDPTTYH